MLRILPLVLRAGRPVAVLIHTVAESVSVTTCLTHVGAPEPSTRGEAIAALFYGWSYSNRRFGTHACRRGDARAAALVEELMAGSRQLVTA